MSIKVGDLVMNKYGHLGMVTEIPHADGHLGAYIEWYPYNPKAGKINYSKDKAKEFRNNFEFYWEIEKRRGWIE
jgi:hypothetical protein